MTEVLRPADADQVRDAVAWAAAEGAALEVAGAGSKAALGRPARPARRLEVGGLSGVALYEPEELVMSAAAGTPLAEVEATLAAEGQELAFEPPDYGPLLGGPAGLATIGGIFACNLSGPRRVKSGAARDFILGVKAVSGRGEAFKAGGRVMKNVTGYDMSKLLTGSYGTLAVLTEVTFKVLPLPEQTRSLLVLGLEDEAAVAAMTRALKSPFEVYGAFHLPAKTAARMPAARDAAPGRAVTAVRVEAPPPSARYCCEYLRNLLRDLGPVEELEEAPSRALWREVRDVTPFAEADGRQVWRLSVTPGEGAQVVREIAGALDSLVYYDWGGGLVWLAAAPGEGAEAALEAEGLIRRVVRRAGGNAVLVRAPDEVRARVPVFQALAPELARLTERLKDSFDPARVLNPGRMYENI